MPSSAPLVIQALPLPPLFPLPPVGGGGSGGEVLPAWVAPEESGFSFRGLSILSLVRCTQKILTFNFLPGSANLDSFFFFLKLLHV